MVKTYMAKVKLLLNEETTGELRMMNKSSMWGLKKIMKQPAALVKIPSEPIPVM